MADEDDDECFVTIGTAFDIPEKDEQPRKQFDKHEQVAVDSKGRRRFHGAFTGGFSAGYFNSVGSKEGWTPSTFLSSRSSRAEKEKNVQRPEDFMDDDDFGDFGIAPKKFMTKEDFSPADREINERKRVLGQAVQDGVVRSAIPGGIPVDDLIIPSRLSVGVQLLQKMGWKVGQGIGEKQEMPKLELEDSTLSNENRSPKKVYGCAVPQSVPSSTDLDYKSIVNLLAPKDAQSINFTPKENVHGIGYKGLIPGAAFALSADYSSRSFKPTGREKKGIRGQAFGVGAFEEEDENIYGAEDMSEYDFALSSEKEPRHLGWSGPPRKDKEKGAIAGFQKASRPTAINKIFRPPLLPANYVPGQNVSKSKSSKNINEGGGFSSLNSNARALLLGEKVSAKHVASEIVQSSRNSVMSQGWELSSTNESNLGATIKKPGELEPERPRKPSRWDTKMCCSITYAGRKDPSQEGSFQPFLNDPEKQQRYDSYLESKRFGKSSEMKYSENLTEWEKEREMEEFARASILFRPMSSFISSRFTRGTESSESIEKGDKKQEDQIPDCEKAAKLGMFGKMTRTTYEWHPSAILCRRFNVPHPYPGSRFTGTPGQEKRRASNWLPVIDTTTNDEDSSRPCNSARSSRETKPENLENEKGRYDSEEISITSVGNKVMQPAAFDGKTLDEKGRSTESCKQAGPLSYLNDKEEVNKKGVTVPGTSLADADAGDRPSLDLFKAIFSNSEDNSSSESDGEENAGLDEEKRNKVKTETDQSREEVQGSQDDDFTEKQSESDISIKIINTSRIERHPPETSENVQMTLSYTSGNDASSGVDLFGPSLPPRQKGVDDHKLQKEKRILKDREKSPEHHSGTLSREAHKKSDTKRNETTSESKKSNSKTRKSETRKSEKKKHKKNKSKKRKKKSHKTTRKSEKYLDRTDSSSEWSSGPDEACEGPKSNVYRDDDRDLEIKSDKRMEKRRNRHEEREQHQEKKSADIYSDDTSAERRHSRKSDSEERVPSARDIYKKLKNQGLSIQRMSAADFM